MQICNEGLKLMLRDSSTRELEEYKDKVSSVGANFSKEEDMQGATFAYVLYKMTEHIQVEEIHKLQVANRLLADQVPTRNLHRSILFCQLCSEMTSTVCMHLLILSVHAWSM